MLDGGVLRKCSLEKHLAKPPNALLTRLNLAAFSAAFNVDCILDIGTERCLCARTRCLLWVECLSAQNKLNTRLTHHPKTALNCLRAERVNRET